MNIDVIMEQVKSVLHSDAEWIRLGVSIDVKPIPEAKVFEFTLQLRATSAGFKIAFEVFEHLPFEVAVRHIIMEARDIEQTVYDNY